MRRGFGLAWALLSLLVVGVASWFAYNAGLVQGLAQGGHPTDGTAVVPYPYPYHYGFGFGIFPLFLFVILLFFLFRRPWGHRGYGIEQRMQAWHQKAHGETPPAGGSEPPSATG